VVKILIFLDLAKTISFLGGHYQTISYHLPKMPALANPVNTDLPEGFTVAQVAEKRYTPSSSIRGPTSHHSTTTIQLQLVSIPFRPINRLNDFP